MFDTVAAGHALLADRAYDSDALRNAMADRVSWANIKPVSRRLEKPAFSAFLYREQNLVERFFNKLKHTGQSQRVTTNTPNYIALVKLAAARIWLRSHGSVTELSTRYCATLRGEEFARRRAFSTG